MAFDPAKFLDSAEALLEGPGTQANLRTAAGRAYYAVYGLVRARFCAAKGVTPEALFGWQGRHSDVKDAISRSTAFRRHGPSFNNLLTLRVQSDYDYLCPELTREEVITAVDSAWDAIEDIQRMDDVVVKTLELYP